MVVREGRWRLSMAASTLVQRRWRKKLFWRRVRRLAKEAAARRILEEETAGRLQRWWAKKISWLRFRRAMEHHRLEGAYR